MAQPALTSPGVSRARDLLEQARLSCDVLASLHLLARALDQHGLTADLRAEIHLERAMFESAGLLQTEQAIASFETAANVGASPSLRAVAIAGARYYRFRAGGPLDEELLDWAIGLADAAGGFGVYGFPRLLRGLAVGTYDLDRARRLLEIEVRRTTGRGEYHAIAELREHLAAVELSAGRFAAARVHLAEAEREAGPSARSALDVALWAAIEGAAGNVHEARAAAARAAASDAHDVRTLTHVLAATATLELSLSRPDAAWQALSPMVDARRPEAQAQPVLRLLPGAAEALVELGRIDEAEAIANRLEDVFPALGRSRGPALRARALVAATTDPERTHELFDDALDEHRRLGTAFEEARTLLARGRVLRRARRRRLARESLSEAAALFAELGAQLWAQRARRELARTGGRRGTGDQLTPSEAQIARLAASGRTNREIAQALFVSPKTVEAALSRVYRKLDVRSRSELAARRTIDFAVA
jgi:DNA-binding CsgD family transcriptional regulator